MGGFPTLPDRQLIVAPDRWSAYVATVERGRREMRRRRAVICGLARDVADELPATIEAVQSLGAMFGDYRVVVYENDSADATKPMLTAWSRRDRRVTVLSERRGDPPSEPVRCLRRAGRMAAYRGRYLAHVRDRWSDFDDAVVVDMDLGGAWRAEGVAHSFGCRGWDFIGSYSVLRRSTWRRDDLIHFDAWAFRALGDDTFIPTKQVNAMRWRCGGPLVRVNSCFGGLGIYRMEAMLAGRYDGSDCEHVTFHHSLREAGYDRLFLNPSQVTFYGRRFKGVAKMVHRLIDPPARRAA